MHPFDIKAAFPAKHAQHVVLIHFPIALFLIGVLFDVLARGAKRSMYPAAAYCNLAAAAIATVPVLIWFVFWIHFRAQRNDPETLPAYRLPIEALVAAVVMLDRPLGRISQRSEWAGIKDPIGCGAG